MARVTQPGLGEQFDAILAAAKEGGEWAMATLYRQIQPALLRYLRGRAGQDAEDIAADTWLDVARGLTGFSGSESSFRSWVFTIAHRRFVDHQRTLNRRRPVVGGPAGEGALAAVAAGDDPAATALESVAGDAAVRRLVELLPKAQANVILLRVVGGLSTEDVARITGQRHGTVRVLQHRALRRLARKLEADGEHL